MWLEANYHDYTLGENTKWESQVPMCAIVDNKPLYDHAKSVNDNNIKDKRHAIEMLIVKEDLRIHNIQIRWVATFQMLGDILIKRGVSVDFLLKVMNWGMFTIIEDKSIRPKNQQGKKTTILGVWDFFCYLPLHLVVKDQSDGLCAIGVQRSPLDAGCHSCSPLDGRALAGAAWGS